MEYGKYSNDLYELQVSNPTAHWDSVIISVTYVPVHLPSLGEPLGVETFEG